MADSWVRLDTKAAFGGWTGKLPAEQYAAWVKLLQTVKAFGERGGRIQRSFLDDELLGQLRLTRNAFEQMISSGRKKGKIHLTDNGYIVISAWNKYQLDPTNASRQDRFRKKDVTDVTVTTVSNGSNDDVTGRDVTGRDVNSAPAAQASEAPPRRTSKKTKKTNPLHRPLTDYFCKAWEAKYGETYPYESGKDSKATTNILGAIHNDLPQGQRLTDAYLELEGWAAKHGHKLSLMPGCLAELIAASAAGAESNVDALDVLLELERQEDEEKRQ